MSKGLAYHISPLVEGTSDNFVYEGYEGSVYTNMSKMFLYKKSSYSVIAYPSLRGTFRTSSSYDNKSYLFYDKKSPMYLEFYCTRQVNKATVYNYEGGTSPVETISYNYISGNYALFHYIYKYVPSSNYYTLDLSFYAPGEMKVIPVFMKYETELNNSERTSVGLPTVEEKKMDEIKKQDEVHFNQQMEQNKKQHEEAMDTSKVTEVNGIADNLVKTGNEKTKSLLYPVQWAIDTAHNLASAPTTGTISIPVIFGSGTFDIDLTVIERNVPSVWSFIQNFIRFIVSIGILRGIFGLFKGVDG